MRSIPKRLRAVMALLLSLILSGFALGAAARPALVITIEVKAKDRSSLRSAMVERVAPRLKTDLARGTLDGYHLYASRYPDRGVWDAMAVLTFKNDTALADWTAASYGDAGMDAATLALAETVVSTPVEIGRSAQAPGVGGPHPAFLIVPYQSLVPAAEYSKYLDD